MLQDGADLIEHQMRGTQGEVGKSLLRSGVEHGEPEVASPESQGCLAVVAGEFGDEGGFVVLGATKP